ncbi:uncharacterized protein LOC131675833 [Topomyia yanbarensis]|uniref:uncharacterized protein LOC131675833 n=1 Tax=Topomyia yanbarensis TaxID=2498891 RepID=UPI00273B0CD6|nr:uncharacterized protein LOC131675833 [Topomyia yanbarensis]
MNTLLCHSCANDIAGTHISCRGFCNATFHPKCSGIAENCFDDVLNNKQIFWLCKSCTNLMSDKRHRQAVRAAYEVGQEEVLGAHNQIVENLRTTQRPFAEASRNKARRLFPNKDGAKSNVSSLLRGTGMPVSPSLGTITVADRTPKFWLYLSRIARDVSVDQISILAKQRLITDDVEVVRLVAKDRDVSTMNFISFKVGIKPELKARALSASTWPEGILFREFKSNRTVSAGNFWKPLYPQPDQSPVQADTHQPASPSSVQSAMTE